MTETCLSSVWKRQKSSSHPVQDSVYKCLLAFWTVHSLDQQRGAYWMKTTPTGSGRRQGVIAMFCFVFFFSPEFSEWQTSRSGYCLLLPFWSSWSNYQDTILTHKSHVLLSKPISRKRPPAECQLHLLPLRWPRFLTYRILHRRSAPWLWWGCWASWCFAFFVAHRCGQRLVT